MNSPKTKVLSAEEIYAEIHSHLEVRRNTPRYKENVKRFWGMKTNIRKYAREANKVLGTTDRKLLSLPRPVYRASEELTEILLIGLLDPYELADIACCAEEYPSLYQALALGNVYLDNQRRNFLGRPDIQGFFNDFNSYYESLKTAHIDYLYHKSNSVMIEFTDEVVEQILHTDIGLDVPAMYLKNLNEKGCYLKLGSGKIADLPVVPLHDSGEPVEGVYIFENIYTDQELAMLGNINEMPLCERHLLLRFVSKTDLKSINLFIPNEEMSIHEVMTISQDLTGAEYDLPLIELVTKALLYMNVAAVRKENVLEKTNLLRRVKGREKQNKNKLVAVYDRILIRVPVETNDELDEIKPQGHRKPHYRRGHIRMVAYGEGRLLRRPVYIAPRIINKDKIGSTPVKMKDYLVK